jgi:predicted DNA-binding transcriptional regulator AlpA
MRRSLENMMTYADISALTGIAIGALYVRRNRGSLPPPDVWMDARTPRWTQATIEEWMRDEGLPTDRP